MVTGQNRGKKGFVPSVVLAQAMKWRQLWPKSCGPQETRQFQSCWCDPSIGTNVPPVLWSHRFWKCEKSRKLSPCRRFSVIKPKSSATTVSEKIISLRNAYPETAVLSATVQRDSTPLFAATLKENSEKEKEKTGFLGMVDALQLQIVPINLHGLSEKYIHIL